VFLTFRTSIPIFAINWTVAQPGNHVYAASLSSFEKTELHQGLDLTRHRRNPSPRRRNCASRVRRWSAADRQRVRFRRWRVRQCRSLTN